MSLRFQCDKCGRLHNDHDAEAKCKHEGPREPIGQDEHGLIYDVIEERRMRRHREAQLARCTETMREVSNALLRDYQDKREELLELAQTLSDARKAQ